MKLQVNNRILYEDITHTYIDVESGKELSGCTIVLKRYGISPDYSAIPDPVMDSASERGSRIHKEISDYINFGTCETEAQKEYAKLGLDSIASEYLVSDNENFATSIDVVLGDCSLVDIKTTHRLYANALSWQLSINAYLFELQNPKLKVPKLYGAYYKKDETFSIVEVPRIPVDEVKRLLNAYLNDEEFTPSQTKVTTGDTRIAEIYELEQFITSIKQDAELAEKRKKKLLDALYEEMSKNGIDKIENDLMTITKIAPTESTRVDTGLLKTLHPTIYSEVTKKSPVKGYVKVKIKN